MKDKVINNLLSRISDLEFEVERLKKREQECIDHYLVACKYASEMEDKYIITNNIINELEKTLNERKNKTNREPMTERTKIRINYNLDYVLNRLKELKGDESNENNNK